MTRTNANNNLKGWMITLLLVLLALSQACSHPSGVRYDPYPAGHPGAVAPYATHATPAMDQEPRAMSDAERLELERFEETVAGPQR